MKISKNRIWMLIPVVIGWLNCEALTMAAEYTQEKTSSVPCIGECWLTEYLDPVHDFPKKGVLFQWYRPLLSSSEAFSKVIDILKMRYIHSGIQGVVALDSRGFLFGSALAYAIKQPLILVRKGGKLPGPVHRTEYQLEYGKDYFEIETKSISSGQRVLLIDDVIATGGTMVAAAKLVRQSGGVVHEACALMSLPKLHGEQTLKADGILVFALMSLAVAE